MRENLLVRGLRSEERGAQLVEFAILAPLLIVLIVGIMETAWTFSDVLNVRHAAREGARVAAVNDGEPIAAACGGMKASLASTATVTVPVPADKGDSVTVTITATHSSLSGLFPFFEGLALTETATIRYERSVPPAPAWTAAATCSELGNP